MSDEPSVREVIDQLELSEEVKEILVHIHEEVSGAYEDRVKHSCCKNCKLWTVPGWNTNGFGTCYLPSSRRNNKLLPVLSVVQGSIHTHESFGCLFFEGKK